MNEKLRILKQRSKMRRIMMANILGYSNVQQLYHALNHFRGEQLSVHSYEKVLKKSSISPEYTSYEVSSTFQNTNLNNVHNDYSQHFIDTGQRPQNFIRDASLPNRFIEFPKLRELINLKDELVHQTSSPPMYLKCNLNTYNLNDLKNEFDVILVEPPLEEYHQTLGVTNIKLWNWEKIMKLKLDEISASRSFIFLWCGSSDGLDYGRDCLRHWGFRRSEDICWIQTNIKNTGYSKNLQPKALFQRTKEHCLMGIKGTVRRATDSNFIHTNIDTDLIISEKNELGSMEKPVEIFNIIEHFCLGKRRLHLFGCDSTVRPGWLTLGHELTYSNYNEEIYNGYFSDGQLTTGYTDRIEELRPKEPTTNSKIPIDRQLFV